MHEIGVLYKMLEQVESVAKENHVRRVKKIEIELGELCGMLPVFFEQYYEPATENKELFKGSELVIRNIPGEGLCTDCNTLYNVMRFEGQCPKCRSRNKKIISGRDFVVKNILVETEEEPDTSQKGNEDGRN